MVWIPLSMDPRGVDNLNSVPIIGMGCLGCNASPNFNVLIPCQHLDNGRFPCTVLTSKYQFKRPAFIMLKAERDSSLCNSSFCLMLKIIT